MVRTRVFGVLLSMVLLGAAAASPAAAAGPGDKGQLDCQGQQSGDTCNGLTEQQRNALYAIARDTWHFYDPSVGVDANTHLPLDNIGFQGAPAKGTYTSPTNIGVYMWSIVAAVDLHLISMNEGRQRLAELLTTVEHLEKWHGLLFSWYDTTTAHHIDHPAPNSTDLNGQDPTGQFMSAVDNSWYAAGLVITRQAVPELKQRATALLDAIDLGLFYDSRTPQTDVLADSNGTSSGPNDTAGQQYGGWMANQGPAGFHYGILNTETRIGAYVGIGTNKMPGDVWWRTWRTFRPGAYFAWQNQVPQGTDVTYRDPRSSKLFKVFEGHFSESSIQFVPSWGGSQFEALMPNLVEPETAWGPHSFGLNDRNYALAEIAYASRARQSPVWGFSPSSTPDDTGNYIAWAAHNLATNPSLIDYQDGAVSPHASFLALDVLPQEAFANIQKLRSLYPHVYGSYGFYDAVCPGPTNCTYNSNGTIYTTTPGQIGHRYLVLDQAMIMAALDNALVNRAMQCHFSSDPVGAAARPYLAMETFSAQRSTAPGSSTRVGLPCGERG